MKKIIFLSLFILFSSAKSGLCVDGYRVLTDKKERQIKAKPVSVIGAKIRIKREDGAEFNVDPSIFSDKDKHYLESWRLKQLIKDDRLFSMKASEKKGKVDKHDSVSTKTKRWKSGYKIEIENLSDLNIKDYEIRYRFYKFDDKIAAQKRKDGRHVAITGSDTLSLLPRGEITLETKKTDMMSSALKSNWYYTGGGSDDSKDKLTGIWVRVYKDNMLVHEFANPESVMEREEW